MMILLLWSLLQLFFISFDTTSNQTKKIVYEVLITRKKLLFSEQNSRASVKWNKIDKEIWKWFDFIFCELWVILRKRETWMLEKISSRYQTKPGVVHEFALKTSRNQMDNSQQVELCIEYMYKM